MKRTFRAEIDGRVFTEGDIRAMAQLLWELYEQAQSSSACERDAHVTYSIAFTDGSVASSNAMDVFDDGEWIDLKRAQRISMEFEDRVGHREVGLFIVAGSERLSSIEVEGPEQEWVGGKFRRIQTLIESARPRPAWIRHWALPSVVVFISTCLFVFLEVLLSSKGIGETSYVPRWVLILMAISPIHVAMLNQLSKIWPMIEFDFGPAHMRTARTRRKAVGWVIGTLLLPVALGVITNLIT